MSRDTAKHRGAPASSLQPACGWGAGRRKPKPNTRSLVNEAQAAAFVPTNPSFNDGPTPRPGKRRERGWNARDHCPEGLSGIGFRI